MIGEVSSQRRLKYLHYTLNWRTCFWLIVFHQLSGNFPANQFWNEGTSKISKWVGNCSCSASNIVSPQTMKY